MLDIDRFIARHQPTWSRLEELTIAARQGPKKLEPGAVDDLVRHYQLVSSHLAHARAAYDDPGLLARLNRIVAEAGAAVYGRRPRTGSAFARFFVASFPAALWSSMRFVVVSAALLLVPAVVVGAWVAADPVALDLAIDPAVQDAYLQSEFEDYYSSAPAATFSSYVTVNNIRVSAVAFALGAAACLPGAVILVMNGVNVGVAGGLFVANGQGGKFFGLILPHGLLELTAIVIAGAAGLRVGWALLAPGDRTRGDALAAEGRRSVVLVLGCVLAFVVAGLIEGFVTPAPVPTALRVAVGAAVWLLFVVWVVGQGRRAVAEGFTGLPADDERAWDARRRAQSLPTALADR